MTWTPDTIKNLRKQTGHTQQSLATVMGISIETIRSWEQGRKKPSAMARRAAASSCMRTVVARSLRWLDQET